MTSASLLSACPYCRSLRGVRYRGWTVIVAICDGCGKTYTIPVAEEGGAP